MQFYITCNFFSNLLYTFALYTTNSWKLFMLDFSLRCFEILNTFQWVENSSFYFFLDSLFLEFVVFIDWLVWVGIFWVNIFLFKVWCFKKSLIRSWKNVKFSWNNRRLSVQMARRFIFDFNEFRLRHFEFEVISHYVWQVSPQRRPSTNG